MKIPTDSQANGSPSHERAYDLVIFGATSFVGQIIVRHLVERTAKSDDVTAAITWAIAGRSVSKLATVAKDTGATVDQLVVDAENLSELQALAKRTKVIASTVGPYALYGSKLVQACAENGTDYVDLTGEPQWMQQMIDTHTDAAAASGARIVHSCGFDSIPSDLGVWYVQQQSIEQFGQACTQIGMRLAGAKGGASGGTVASLMNVVAEATKDKSLRNLLANPYALAPKHLRHGVGQPNVTVPTNDKLSGQWVAPFVMAGINTKIVHRSHALLGRPWGEEFLYDEALLTGDGPLGVAKATAVTGAMGGFMGVAIVPPFRKLLNRFVLPKPGEGPSATSQATGFFDLRFFGHTAAGQRLAVKVTGDRDPGYGSTAKMMVAAALTLLHTSRQETAGGFWTPSTAMGAQLLAALQRDAGLSFTVL